jgi:hypothetical protein
MPDINSGEPWSEMDLADLDEFLTAGHLVESIASYLCRDVDEVAVKIERKQHADLPHPTRLLRASTASGQAAATPSSVMNRRRFIRLTGSNQQRQGIAQLGYQHPYSNPIGQR